MKKFLQRLKKDERGLTLVELLAVVVILAIVGAIAFVAIGNVIENSRQDAHVANAQQLISAAKLAEVNGLEIDATDGVSSDDLDTIGDLTNPWDSSDTSYKGTVKKTGNAYTVTITGKDDTISLEITDATEADINEGRKGLE